MSFKKITLPIALLAGAFSTASFAHEGATGIVKERMDRFKASKESMKLIKAAYAGGDFVTISSEAASLVDWASVMLDYFPEDSNNPPSEASWHIWHMWDDFEVKSVDYLNATQQLKAAADAGDADALKAAYGAVGQSCKACHDHYKE